MPFISPYTTPKQILNLFFYSTLNLPSDVAVAYPLEINAMPSHSSREFNDHLIEELFMNILREVSNLYKVNKKFNVFCEMGFCFHEEFNALMAAYTRILYFIC